jgi:phospholipid/cholesterol/gamma-HCH transport system permease protein
LALVADGPLRFVAPLASSAEAARQLHRSYVRVVGSALLHLIATIQGLGAFALIALGVTFTRFHTGARVIRPLIREHIYRAGVRLLPMITFLGLALGFVVIGQTVALLSRVNVTDVAGKLMVTVVVRELGPMITALIVLARVGTANVVELGTARAQGEVEALEALNIDPIHYLVIPRVLGVAIAVFALTVYLIITALLSGYLFIFLQDVPLMPGDYFRQLATSLIWEDFALLGLKTLIFGFVIALTTSYQGLAQPLRLEDVPRASTNAVVASIAGCVFIDALFIVVYLVM